MTRINTNVSSIVAQHSLAKSNTSLQEAMTRLSTGLRINVGKDDPAGLIASELLRSDIVSTGKAITNTERANQVVGTADSALGEVSSLLNDIRGLITEAANEGALSDEQIAANQLQIDSSLEALNRIAQTTTFQGRRLLDGSFDFITTDVQNLGDLSDLSIEQANLGATGQVSVEVDIAAAATQASLTTTVDSGTGLADDVVFELSGLTGAEVFEFEAGATGDQITDAINLVSDATGVSASYDGGTNTLTLTSTDYGTKAFVDVNVITEGGSGTFQSGFGGTERANGTDIDATVNGVTADADGHTFSINTATLDLTATVETGSAATDIDFTIDGGGALFQIGPDVVSNQQARLGIQSVNSASLGGASGRLYELGSGGNAALETDTTLAAEIVDQVISKVTSLRGRLGAFQKTTLDTQKNTLQATLEKLTEAESTIRDADFAVETANLTRSQILVQSGTSILSIANSNPQNVLSLLG